MSPAVVVLLLTLLLGIQPITTDLYLPALPTLQRDLGASMSADPADAVGADHLLRPRRSWSAGRWPTASAAGRCCWRAWRSTRWPACGSALAPTIEWLIVLARAAGRGHGRGGDLRPLHRARPVRAARRRARDVQGAQRPGRDRDGQPAGRRPGRAVARLARRAAGAWRCSARRRWPSSPGATRRRCRARNPRATQLAPAAAQLGGGAAPPDLPRLDAAVGLRLRRPVLPARRLVLRLHRRARRSASSATA